MFAPQLAQIILKFARFVQNHVISTTSLTKKTARSSSCPFSEIPLRGLTAACAISLRLRRGFAKQKKDRRSSKLDVGLSWFCGESEIRTRDTLWGYTRFPGVPLQPLEHLSNDRSSKTDCKYRKNIILLQYSPFQIKDFGSDFLLPTLVVLKGKILKKFVAVVRSHLHGNGASGMLGRYGIEKDCVDFKHEGLREQLGNQRRARRLYYETTSASNSIRTARSSISRTGIART